GGGRAGEATRPPRQGVGLRTEEGRAAARCGAGGAGGGRVSGAVVAGARRPRRTSDRPGTRRTEQRPRGRGARHARHSELMATHLSCGYSLSYLHDRMFKPVMFLVL